jgi:hypothetical protein
MDPKARRRYWMKYWRSLEDDAGRVLYVNCYDLGIC